MARPQVAPVAASSDSSSTRLPFSDLRRGLLLSETPRNHRTNGLQELHEISIVVNRRQARELEQLLRGLCQIADDGRVPKWPAGSPKSLLAEVHKQLTVFSRAHAEKQRQRREAAYRERHRNKPQGPKRRRSHAEVPR